MAVQIKINPIATSDLQEIKSYIAEENANAAIKTVKEIVDSIERLSQFPESGSMLMYKIKIKSKYRYVICGNYLVFYFYENGIVYIQRVLHGKRDYMVLLGDLQ
ncbi:MAG: type II toxin-antitoxin system mRNA interferase toxin, RelE/StbE family [Firmicutes bacterium HGW-Firmicutes-7]|nr:MAG: type II toxin-antitoxin system mRNA interferase toxin, RelE/StbE family [Firmicutes bacterium HGW-Firmicutes-7]